jgi:hypothetical protein
MPSWEDSWAVAVTSPDLARENPRLREQRRAFSVVLRAVEGSAGLQPVLDEIIDAAARLCRGDHTQLYLATRISFGSPRRAVVSARRHGFTRSSIPTRATGRASSVESG